ncbi:MAG TPA: Ig-like domain-containing protein [Rhizomicrobium sp.]|nr:Ig-like domain-containing protein [Rhizomicrobium sp.]
MTGSSRAVGVASIVLLLSACGGGGSKSPAPAPAPPPPASTTRAYTISGTVNGLDGTVVLAVNGGSDVTVTSHGDTTAALTTTLENGASYTVSVKTQPSNPAQVCSVSTGASGTVTASSPAAITGVVVTCVTTPLTLVSSTPATGAGVQSCSIAPKLVFSHPLSSATAVASNFSLTNGGAPAQITISVSGAEVTVTPTSVLSKTLSYTLTASAALRGTNGEMLAAPVSVTFTCDGKFGTPVKFPKNPGDDAGGPVVAMDQYGYGFATWTQGENGLLNVYARRYTPGQGWGTAELVEHQTTNAYTSVVGFDAAGNAWLMFLVSDGANANSVWVNRWSETLGWGTETRIDALPDDAENPQIAVSPSGHVIASWYQSDSNIGGWYRATANYYTPGSGWSGAQFVDTVTNVNAVNARCAIDPNGNAMVVWQQRGGPWGNDIMSRRYVAGSGWDAAPTPVETDNSGSANSVRVKLDSSGNGIAVWYQHDGTSLRIMANRFGANTGWGTPQPLEDLPGDGWLPRIEMNAAGDAVVAWYQDDGTRTNIWAIRFSTFAGWSTPAPLENDDAGGALYPWVGIDAIGNGLVAWQQSDGTKEHIWASRFTLTGGFGARQRVDDDDVDNADGTSLAMTPDGDALIVWQSSDGTVNTVWGDHFD